MNNRLLKCAEFVAKGGIAADIGTDHGYLPAYLVKNNISCRALACDLRCGPLKSAEETVKAEGVGDKVSLYLSDGLDSVPSDGVTDVICAGMGGELIFEIINRAEFIKSRQVNLVLQPMTKAEVLRRELFCGGYEILCEEAVRDGRFIYTVINARFTGKRKEPDGAMCCIGGLTPGREADREYILRVQKKLITAAEGIKRSGKELDKAKALLSTADDIEKILEGKNG